MEFITDIISASGGTLVSVLLGLGVVQAIIGIVKGLGFSGVPLLAVTLAVVWAVVGLTYALGGYEVYRWLLAATMVTLASAGYWRFRKGETPPLSPEDPALTEV